MADTGSASVIRAAIEWPTVAVAALIYGAFGMLTWHYHALAWWLVLPLAAYLIAWHGSLQHEVVHDHPTSWRWLNRLLVLPSLWLWLPFELYRESHQAHHRNEFLTDPLQDPESYYLSAAQWQQLPPWRQALRWSYNTVLGRLVLGPWFALFGLVRTESQRLRAGDWRMLPGWGLHAVGCALVLLWVLGVCRIPLLDYLLLFVYPGISLSLLRSFLEHQAHPDWRQRTVSIEAHPLLALLFLNNNLHIVHHAAPGLPWYRLPARWRAQRDAFLALNGGYRYSGYAEVIARYLLWPKEPPVHPQEAAVHEPPSSPPQTSAIAV